MRNYQYFFYKKKKKISSRASLEALFQLMLYGVLTSQAGDSSLNPGFASGLAVMDWNLAQV